MKQRECRPLWDAHIDVLQHVHLPLLRSVMSRHMYRGQRQVCIEKPVASENEENKASLADRTLLEVKVEVIKNNDHLASR